jgi:hypothetical protein
MSKRIISLLMFMAIIASAWGQEAEKAGPGHEIISDMPIFLENDCMVINFDKKTSLPSSLTNKLTGEKYQIQDEGFIIEAADWRVDFSDMACKSLAHDTHILHVLYQHPKLSAKMSYTLKPDRHFLEMQLSLTFKEACGLKQIVIGRPRFSADGLTMACCRYPDFDIVSAMVKARHGWDMKRPPDSEPTRTFFGRTPKGGFFTGLEMPYDASSLDENRVTLCYAPSLKIKKGQKLVTETMYLGVYRRSEQDEREDNSWQSVETLWSADKKINGFDGAVIGIDAKADTAKNAITVPRPTIMPLPGESQAMAAMASAVLGPPRHGLMAFACGWHCQMQQDDYDTDEELEGDLKSLELFKQCGLDGFTESHPWGGETRKMNALRDGDRYEIGPRNRRLLERANELGLIVTQWPTMNNTHPWRKPGGPFRLDEPAWLRGVEGKPVWMENAGDFEHQFANCLACRPFADWLEKLIADTLATGFYKSWCMDGDFWGTGAYFHTTIPVTCTADWHDHLAGDSNYACQNALQVMVAKIRRQHPDIYVIMCRPLMDLGVWALRDVDACFTLIESGTGGSNIAAGDEIRTASRIRLHHQFVPHWLDQSLLFPSYGDTTLKNVPPWPAGKIDYIMLSAMSSSPNLLMYLPTKTGIPDVDKQEIKKWLDWGRKNSNYLMVRRDLPGWPQKGTVDGSAHILDDHGLIFLFNSDKTSLSAQFALIPETIGLTKPGSYIVRQEYPPSDQTREFQSGQTAQWSVPPETALILTLTPSSEKSK